MKNYGINLEKERLEQSEKDWKFGATSPTCIALIPENEREKYLPKGEIQRGTEDTMDCVSRAYNNDIEKKLNWLLKNKLLPLEVENFFRNKGYITENGFELCDRYIAILSGTTRQGNSLKAPIEAIRKYGCIPKRMLPLESWMSFDDYHNPESITAEMRALGYQFLDKISVNYEQVFNFEEALKTDSVIVAGYAWSNPVNGEYPREENEPNHCWMNFKNKYFAFDNYIDIVDGDFIKKLAPDYKLFDYGYRVILSYPTKKEETLNFIERMIKFIAEQLGLIEKEVKKVVENSQPIKPIEKPVELPEPKYKWDTKENIRHSIRVICDEEKMSLKDKNEITATIRAESDYNLQAKNENKINGKVVSVDYGLCQINTFYHIGEGKSFPSIEFVLNNPDVVVRWMCKQWKAGNKNWWIAYRSGAYIKFL